MSASGSPQLCRCIEVGFTTSNDTEWVPAGMLAPDLMLIANVQLVAFLSQMPHDRDPAMCNRVRILRVCSVYMYEPASMSRTEMPMFLESHEENTDVYRMSEDVHKAGIPKWIPWSVQLRHVNRSAIGPWRQDSLAPGCQLSIFSSPLKSKTITLPDASGFEISKVRVRRFSAPFTLVVSVRTAIVASTVWF